MMIQSTSLLLVFYTLAVFCAAKPTPNNSDGKCDMDRCPKPDETDFIVRNLMDCTEVEVPASDTNGECPACPSYICKGKFNLQHNTERCELETSKKECSIITPKRGETCSAVRDDSDDDKLCCGKTECS